MKKIKDFKIVKTEHKKFELYQKLDGYSVGGNLGFLKQEMTKNIKVCVNPVEKGNEQNYFFTTIKDQHTFLTNLRLNIIGVLNGFGKELIIKGIGYKVWKVRNKLFFKVGYSHWVQFEIPKDLIIRGKKNRLIIFGSKKDKVGLVSNLLRSIREPDVYKGKGFQYLDEVLILKTGKQRQR